MRACAFVLSFIWHSLKPKKMYARQQPTSIGFILLLLHLFANITENMNMNRVPYFELPYTFIFAMNLQQQQQQQIVQSEAKTKDATDGIKFGKVAK